MATFKIVSVNTPNEEQLVDLISQLKEYGFPTEGIEFVAVKIETDTGFETEIVGMKSTLLTEDGQATEQLAAHVTYLLDGPSEPLEEEDNG